MNATRGWRGKPAATSFSAASLAPQGMGSASGMPAAGTTKPQGFRLASARAVKTIMKRKYPKHPIVGVGGVVIDRDRALLIRRGREPLKGQWSIPGGMLELGEELTNGVRRELKEETGLDVEPLECILVFDRIMHNGRRVKYHYVIVDYLCRKKRGRLRPASDVIDARWVRRKDLPRYHLTEMALLLILRAFKLVQKH
jgi:8-oxo-dGTP diphosphatase